MPGSAAVASVVITSLGSADTSGSGPPSVARSSARLAVLRTGRSGKPSEVAQCAVEGLAERGFPIRSIKIGHTHHTNSCLSVWPTIWRLRGRASYIAVLLRCAGCCPWLCSAH